MLNKLFEKYIIIFNDFDDTADESIKLFALP